MSAMDKSTPESRRLAREPHRQTGGPHQRNGQRNPGFHPGLARRLRSRRRRITSCLSSNWLDEIRPEIELKSATIELENPPPPVKLLLDPKRLRRVFYNLIHNATDAMPRRRKNPHPLQPRRRRGHHRNRGHRAGHRAGNRRPVVRRVRHLRQGPRHRPGPFHLQKNH